ncbi:MAG: response regulator [Hyphomonadaceae bacterium]|nr:response regulator [Hyphomonadaceae bacterium]
MSGVDPSLFGLRVFAVEDEALIALMLEVMLEELGCKVVGVAGTVPRALAQVETMGSDIGAAILDVNIGGEKVYPVADALAVRGVPFLFCTGYAATGIIEPYRDRIVLDKPYSKTALANALAPLAGKHPERHWHRSPDTGRTKR